MAESFRPSLALDARKAALQMSGGVLSDREKTVLEAVIRTYVETAEPAGSRMVARRCGLGVSAATVRNTMADLEERGFLYHPHTSAGRIPTDLAYRFYVDALMPQSRVSVAEQRRLRRGLLEGEGWGPLALLMRRAAQVLGLLTGDLGVAMLPRLDEAVLQRLELIAITGEKVLLVLQLSGGAVHTVYVDVRTSVPPQALASVSEVLNERLAGRALREIRQTLPDRLRDAATGDDSATELLNIFLQSGEDLFQAPDLADDDIQLGRASVLAAQPEFSSGTGLKSLLELTERRDLLADVLGGSGSAHEPLRVTIGIENRRPELASFTLVTSEYRVGELTGVVGVIGPTRMPYDKVTAIVESASALLSDLLSAEAAERNLRLTPRN
jgi:heat-inducible transcriptional repressor